MNDEEKTRRRKTPRLPTTEDEWRLSGLATFYNFYPQDDTFCVDLIDLFQAQRDALTALEYTQGPMRDDLLQSVWEGGDDAPEHIKEYAEAVRAFAIGWGLNCAPRGMFVVDFWCSLRQRNPDFSPSNFCAGNIVFTPHPRVWEPARIRVTVDEPWLFRKYTAAQVRKAVLAACRQQIETEILRNLTDLEAAGYVFPDTQSKRYLYACWLFQRVALRRTSREIADNDSKFKRYPTESTILNETNDMAARLGIRIPPSKR